MSEYRKADSGWNTISYDSAGKPKANVAGDNSIAENMDVGNGGDGDGGAEEPEGGNGSGDGKIGSVGNGAGILEVKGVGRLGW